MRRTTVKTQTTLEDIDVNVMDIRRLPAPQQHQAAVLTPYRGRNAWSEPGVVNCETPIEPIDIVRVLRQNKPFKYCPNENFD
jgi:hypothetical protein